MPIDAKAMSQVTKFNVGPLIRTVCFQDQQSISPIKLILLSQEKIISLSCQSIFATVCLFTQQLQILFITLWKYFIEKELVLVCSCVCHIVEDV